MDASDPNGRPLQNAVKLVGEGFVPGASLLIDGKILAGGAHAIAGTVARAALGPLGLILVIANSYSTSTTGKSLFRQLVRRGKDAEEEAVKAAPAA